jgi:aspartate kinase
MTISCLGQILVEKVGGTSMSSFEVVVDNVIRGFGGENKLNRRAIIVSAFGGITDLLLENKRDGAPGVYGHFIQGLDWRAALNHLRDIMYEHHRRFYDQKLPLEVDRADQFVTERIDTVADFLNNVRSVLAYGYVESEPLMRAAREMLAGIGEAHSAFVATNILNNLQIPVTLVDLTGWDDNMALTIGGRIDFGLRQVDFNNTIAIITGYCKGTEGIMRHFDRGYSEVTFSQVAVTVQAIEAVIHKEFHLSSADPRIVGADKIVPIGRTNFDVADQLADVGMEAIHPKASKPLERAGIAVRVRNVFDPNHTGTLITIDGRSSVARVEIITGTRNMRMLEVYDTAMVGGVGFDYAIMDVIVRAGMSYVFKGTNANTITMTFHDRDWQPNFCETLAKDFEYVTCHQVSLVCVVGSNLDDTRILALATQALSKGNIKVLAFSQASRSTSIQFVVEREYYDAAIRVLHSELIEKSDIV